VTLFPHSTSKLAWIATTWNHHFFFATQCYWTTSKKIVKSFDWFFELLVVNLKKFKYYYQIWNFLKLQDTETSFKPHTHTYIYTWWTSSCRNHFPMSKKSTKWCTLTKLHFKVIRQEAYKYIYCDTLYSSTLKHLSAKYLFYFLKSSSLKTNDNIWNFWLDVMLKYIFNNRD
jgi:hypothetical protein